MATSEISGVIQHLRKTVLLRDGADLTDAQLLEKFTSHRDAVALESLVLRHGPMVWGVCRRVLRNPLDAEDAFQATFLVLVRKAASIVPSSMVGNWLYGVAYQTALKALATVAKRKTRERQVTEMPEPVAAEENHWRDLQLVLDEELSQLPDKYRACIVLCDLVGKTRKEVSLQLGVPEGTVAGRLSRARTMLAKRLTKRGLDVSGGALAVVLAQNVASAGVPTSVVSATIQAASLLATGQAASGVISSKVAALTEGVLKTMLLTKLKIATATVLMAAIACFGVGGLLEAMTPAGREEPTKESKAKPDTPANETKPAKPANDNELIQGTWVVVYLQQTDRESTQEEKEFFNKGGYKITITDEKMIHSPDNSEAKYRLNLTKNPKVLELIEDGKVLAKAIYELKGDDLKICMGRKSDRGEPLAPSDFDIKKAAPGSDPTLFVMKREADKKDKDTTSMARAMFPELTKIDRTIAKEPKYTHQPYYALLAFGPKAENRVWLVVDGKVLYVDRNGNGDLTEAGERVPLDIEATKKIQVAPGMYKGMNSFNLGTVHGIHVRVDFWVRDLDFIPETNLDNEILKVHEKNGLENSTLFRVNADGRDVPGQTPLAFCREPKGAQICHLGGPLAIAPGSKYPLVRNAKNNQVSVMIGTPGLPPRNSNDPVFAPLGVTEVPANVHPVAHVEFPHKDADQPPIKLEVVLDERWSNSFYGPVRVPANAANGRAKVTVLFPAWKEAKVSPATFEVPVVDEVPPVEVPRAASDVGQTQAVHPHPDWLPLGTVRTGTIVEACFAIYAEGGDPKQTRMHVEVPPFVQVVDKSIIERERYAGDKPVRVGKDKPIKGVAGVVVIRIDTSKPGVFQGLVKVKMGLVKAGAVTAKMPVSVIVKPTVPDAVKILVVDSPFHWNSTSDPSVFKEWTDLADDAGWNVSYLIATNGKPVFRDLDLSKFDVILFDAGGLTTAGNAEDLKRARAFAENGGRLVLAASRFYSGSVDAANKVVDGYGLKILNEEGPIGPKRFIEPVILDKESFAPEVTKAGIKSARFHRASPIVVSPDKPARVLVKAVDVGGPKDGYVAVAKMGKGEVVLLGQSLWWSWASESGAKGTNNAKLFRLLLTPATEMPGKKD